MSVVLTNGFSLEGGEMALEHAERIKNEGIAMIEQQPGPFRIDLAKLARANSVTVAVLVAWYRHATLRQKPIVFTNLSAELRNIIEFSGLSRILLPANE